MGSLLHGVCMLADSMSAEAKIDFGICSLRQTQRPFEGDRACGAQRSPEGDKHGVCVYTTYVAHLER